jgi:DNA-binding XRE family transcriptional regulator
MLDRMDKWCLTVVRMATVPKTQAEGLRLRQGAKLRDLRKFRQLSQSQLAAAVGVTKAAVSEWEAGKSTPRQHHQVLIARSLNTPWSALFGLDGEAA